MNGRTSKLIDLSTISTTLPPRAEFEVPRESNLASLSAQVDAGNETILFSGRSMSGKTIVLRQFVERNATNCINVFLDSGHNHSSAYNITLQEFYVQLHFYNHGVLPSVPKSGLEIEVSSLFQQVARKARLHNARLIVILDGLFDMGKVNARVVDAILSLLHFNMPSISYIFSVQTENLKFAQSRLRAATHQTIIPAIEEEVRSIFRHCGDIKESETDSLTDLVSLDLSFAASVRRLIDSGFSANEILTGKPQDVQEIFEIEFKRMLALDELAERVVPYLAHTPKVLTSNELTEICRTTTEKMHQFVQSCPQLSFLENSERSVIEINSDAFRNFAEVKLRESRTSTIDSVIDYLKERDEFSRDLPELFEKRNDYRGLADYIGHSYLSAQIDQRGSVFDVQQTVQRALNAAHQSGDKFKAFHFALCSSVILQALHQNNHSGYVHFLLAVGNVRVAQDFARSITNVEERLRVLCQVINHSTDRNREVGEDLLREVRSYYQQLPDELPENEAMSLASELVKVDKELGVQLLTRLAQRADHDNAFDWLMARIMVTDLGSLQNDNLSEVCEAFDGEVRPEQKNALEVIKAILSVNEDPSRLARHVASAKTLDEKVFLARSFARSSAPNSEKIKCLGDVVDSIISEEKYHANAKIFSDFVHFLPSIAVTSQESESYADKIAAQLDEIRRVGPTSDYYQVLIDLSVFQAKHDSSSALEDIYEALDSLGKSQLDVDLRLKCLCRVSQAVSECDPKNDPNWSSLHTLVEEEKETSISSILSDLAYHSDALLPAVYQMLIALDPKVDDLIDRANSPSSKSALVLNCVRRFSTESKQARSTVKLLEFVYYRIDRFCTYADRGTAVTELSKSVCEAVEVLGQDNLEQSIELRAQLLSMMGKISHPVDRAMNAAHVLKAFDGCLEEKQRSKLLKIIESCIDEASVVFPRCVLIFELCRYYSPSLSDISYIANLPDEDTSQLYYEEANAAIFPHLLKLLAALASFGGLLKDSRSLNDFSAYTDVLQKVETPIDRARSLAQLASHLLGVNDGLAKSIVHDEMWDVFSNVSAREDVSEFAKYSLLREIAPITWRVQKDLVLEFVEGAPDEFKDGILIRVFDYIVKGKISGEPARTLAQWPRLDYGEFVLVLDVIDRMKSEVAISCAIQTLARSNKSLKAFDALTASQQGEILRRLERIVDANLPQEHGLVHDGYRILCELICEVAFPRSRITIEHLKSKVSEVPNASDRVFIVSLLLGVLPPNKTSLTRELQRLAITLSEEIPSNLERLARSTTLVENAGAKCRKLVSEKLNEWFSAVVDEESQAHYSRQRGLIDALYQVDEDWASSLASIVDQPNKNERLHSYIEDLHRKAKVEKQMNSPGNSHLDFADIGVICDCYWEALARTNSGEYTSLKERDVTGDFLITSRFDVDEAFPIYGFFVCSTLRSTPEDQKRGVANLLAENVIDCARVYSAIRGGGLFVGGDSSRGLSHMKGSDERIHVEIGQRTTGLDFMKRWALEQEAKGIVIVDPFFDLDQLEVVRFFQEANLYVEISIITGLQSITKNRGDLEHLVRSRWKELYGFEKIPSITFIVPYFVGGSDCPIHDRWILAEESGLELGTSLNGLGNRESSIRLLKGEDFMATREVVNGYLHIRVTEKQNRRIKFHVISLD